MIVYDSIVYDNITFASDFVFYYGMICGKRGAVLGTLAHLGAAVHLCRSHRAEEWPNQARRHPERHWESASVPVPER